MLTRLPEAKGGESTNFTVNDMISNAFNLPAAAWDSNNNKPSRRLECVLLAAQPSTTNMRKQTHSGIKSTHRTHKRSGAGARSRWACRSRGCSRSEESSLPAQSPGCRCIGWWCPPGVRDPRLSGLSGPLPRGRCNT